MKCIILAAGYATRLYPLTKNFPKPLLEVANKPILNHLIEDIDLCGDFDEFIIVSNHKFYPKFKKWAKKLRYNITVLDDSSTCNRNRLGAVKDLQFAIHKCNIKEDCLVIAGDNMLDFSLFTFMDFTNRKKTSCVMYLEEKDEEKLRHCGVLELDDYGLVTNVEEKPEHPQSSYICPPFYFYVASDLARIDEALADGCEYDAPGSFLVWLSHKSTIHATEAPGRRFDIGNLESYQATKRYFETWEDFK